MVFTQRPTEALVLLLGQLVLCGRIFTSLSLGDVPQEIFEAQMTPEQIARSMAYKNTFTSEHGQTVLKDLDRFGFFVKPDSCCDLGSVNTTYFNLGKLAIIRYIHDEISKSLTKTEDNKAVHKEI